MNTSNSDTYIGVSEIQEISKPFMNRQVKSEIAKINKVITKIIPPNITLTDLNNLTYASAAHIQIKFLKKISPNNNITIKRTNKNKESPWKRKQLKNTEN